MESGLAKGGRKNCPKGSKLIGNQCAKIGIPVDEVQKDDPFYGTPWGTFSAWKNEEMENLWSKINPLCDNTFKKVMVGEADHIWRAFHALFGGGNQK